MIKINMIICHLNVNTIGQPSRLQELVAKLIILLSFCISFTQFLLNTTIHAMEGLTNQFTEFLIFYFLIVIEDSVDTKVTKYATSTSKFLKIKVNSLRLVIVKHIIKRFDNLCVNTKIHISIEYDIY